MNKRTREQKQKQKQKQKMMINMNNTRIIFRWTGYIPISHPLLKNTMNNRFIQGVGRFKEYRKYWWDYDRAFQTILETEEDDFPYNMTHDMDEPDFMYASLVAHAKNELLGIRPLSTPYKEIKEDYFSKDIQKKIKVFKRVHTSMLGTIIIEFLFILQENKFTQEKSITYEKQLKGYVNQLNKQNLVEQALKAIPQEINKKYQTKKSKQKKANKLKIRREFWTALLLTKNPQAIKKSQIRIFRTHPDTFTNIYEDDYDEDYMALSKNKSQAVFVFNSLYLNTKRSRRKFREHLFAIIDIVNIFMLLFMFKEQLISIAKQSITKQLAKDLNQGRTQKDKQTITKQINKEWKKLVFTTLVNPKTLFTRTSQNPYYLIPSQAMREIARNMVKHIHLYDAYQEALWYLIQSQMFQQEILFALLSQIQEPQRKQKQSLHEYFKQELSRVQPLTKPEQQILQYIVIETAKALQEKRIHDLQVAEKFLPVITRTELYARIKTRRKIKLDSPVQKLINKGFIIKKEIHKAVGRPSKDGKARIVYQINAKNKSILAITILLTKIPKDEYKQFYNEFFNPFNHELD